jgi:GH24 family phage-related lysozyme (muramidase)
MLGLLFEFLTNLLTGTTLAPLHALPSASLWDRIDEACVHYSFVDETLPRSLREHLQRPTSPHPPPASPAGQVDSSDNDAALPLPRRYLEEIKKSEGFRRRAARDYKQHSNGYGTRARFRGEMISRDEAERRFRSEISKAAAAVDRFAPNLPVGVRAALTSLTFNAGADWTRDGLGQAIRAKDMVRARRLFLAYKKAGGRVRRGLVTRRQSEAAWFDVPLTGRTY